MICVVNINDLPAIPISDPGNCPVLHYVHVAVNDQSLSQTQIVFVKKVIDYVVQNGYIENVSELMRPPFDKPQSFIKLFDGTRQKQIVETITKIKENAVRVVKKGKKQLITVCAKIREGEGMESAYTFEDYKLKVNRYIEEHRDHFAIYKLRNNIHCARPSI